MNKKKRGAPAGNQHASKPDSAKKPRTKYVNISIHPDDAERYRQQAETLGLSIAAFIKLKCGGASKMNKDN